MRLHGELFQTKLVLVGFYRSSIQSDPALRDDRLHYEPQLLYELFAYCKAIQTDIVEYPGTDL